MKKVIAAAALTLTLAHFQTSEQQNGGRCVLPNPKRLQCRSSDCTQLWSDKPEAGAVFPKQIIVDMDHNCIYGVTALHDKSASVDVVETTIDERYKKWASADFANSPVRLWRVEPEKLAIQFSGANEQDEKRNVTEVGAKQVIFLPIGGRSACASR